MSPTRLWTACAVALASGGLAACTAGSTGSPPISSVSVSNPNYAKLQFAVGTANIFGSATGLNVVSTLRQPSGASAIGAGTPTIAGPFRFGAAPQPAVGSSLPDPYTTIPDNGPSLTEVGKTHTISGTPQTLTPGTPFCDTLQQLSGFTTCPPGYTPNATSFGQSGSVFANGLAPFNSVSSTGQSYSYAPYAQPFFDTTAPLFVPWGGPPAFDPDGNGMGTRDGLIPLDFDSFGDPYFLGIGDGLTAFEGVAPQAGTFTLSVQVATVGNNGTTTITTISKTAALGATTPLPAVTAPTVTPDGLGGATVDVSLPAGVTEVEVQIVDYGPGGSPANGTVANCQGPKGTSFAPVYYTLAVTQSGKVALGDTHGPNTNLGGGSTNLAPSPTLCTLAQNKAGGFTDPSGNFVPDNFTVQMIGFDYPAYEMAVSLIKPTVPQTPPIAGPAGQSDVTISPAVAVTYSASSGLYRAVTEHIRARTPRRAGRVTPLRADPVLLRKLGVPD